MKKYSIYNIYNDITGEYKDSVSKRIHKLNILAERATRKVGEKRSKGLLHLEHTLERFQKSAKKTLDFIHRQNRKISKMLGYTATLSISKFTDERIEKEADRRSDDRVIKEYKRLRDAERFLKKRSGQIIDIKKQFEIPIEDIQAELHILKSTKKRPKKISPSKSILISDKAIDFLQRSDKTTGVIPFEGKFNLSGLSPRKNKINPIAATKYTLPNTYVKIGNENLYYVISNDTYVDLNTMKIVGKKEYLSSISNSIDKSDVNVVLDPKLDPDIASLSSSNKSVRSFLDIMESNDSGKKATAEDIKRKIDKGFKADDVVFLDFETAYLDNINNITKKQIYTAGILKGGEKVEIINAEAILDTMKSSDAKKLMGNELFDFITKGKVVDAATGNELSLFDIIKEKGKVTYDKLVTEVDGKRYEVDVKKTFKGFQRRVKKGLKDSDVYAYNAPFEEKLIDKYFSELNTKVKDVRALALASMNEVMSPLNNANWMEKYTNVADEYLNMLGLNGKLKKNIQELMWEDPSIGRFSKYTNLEDVGAFFQKNPDLIEKHLSLHDSEITKEVVEESMKMNKKVKLLRELQRKEIPTDRIAREKHIARLNKARLDVDLLSRETAEVTALKHVTKTAKTVLGEKGFEERLNKIFADAKVNKIGVKTSYSKKYPIDSIRKIMKKTNAKKRGYSKSKATKMANGVAASTFGDDIANRMAAETPTVSGVSAFKTIGAMWLYSQGISLWAKMMHAFDSQQDVIEKQNTIEGLKHNSILTTVNRILSTDFGSAWRGLSGASSKILRNIMSFGRKISSNATLHTTRYLGEFIEKQGRKYSNKLSSFMQGVTARKFSKDRGILNAIENALKPYTDTQRKRMAKAAKISAGVVGGIALLSMGARRKDPPSPLIPNHKMKEIMSPSESEERERLRQENTDFGSPAEFLSKGWTSLKRAFGTAWDDVLRFGSVRSQLITRETGTAYAHFIEGAKKLQGRKTTKTWALNRITRDASGHALGRTAKKSLESQVLDKIAVTQSVFSTASKKVDDALLRARPDINWVRDIDMTDIISVKTKNHKQQTSRNVFSGAYWKNNNPGDKLTWVNTPRANQQSYRPINSIFGDPVKEKAVIPTFKSKTSLTPVTAYTKDNVVLNKPVAEILPRIKTQRIPIVNMNKKKVYWGNNFAFNNGVLT